MEILCPSCSQKDTLIQKYTKLIKLLKTNEEKLTQSSIKTSKTSSDSDPEPSDSSIKSNSSHIELQILDLSQKPTVSLIREDKTSTLKLAFTVICNKIKKSLLKSVFNQIKNSQLEPNFQHVDIQISQASSQNPPSLMEFIQKTMTQGKALQISDKNPLTTLKSLYTNQFSLQNINRQLKTKVQKLELELKEAFVRFQKETEKKREGLEAVAEEILQKNDHIAELQHTIKQYQKISGKSFQKVNIQNVLIEDQIELKRTCFRLEGINEKLNSELKNAHASITELKSEIQSLKKQNISLKSEMTSLKEQNFDFLGQAHKVQELSQAYTNLCQKLNLKIEKLKKTQKREINASRQCFSDLQNLKIDRNSTNCSPILNKSSFRQLEAEQKIESIFSFIFNIQDETHRIMNQDLFDEDELSLMKAHKNAFLNSIHNQKPQNKPKTQKVIKKPNLDESDEIFFIQQPKGQIEISFLNVFELKQTRDKKKQNETSNNLKLMELQVEKSKFVQKIADIKKVHMHIREVLLKFLKSIQLTNLKPEGLQILDILFDVFEYSQDEKASLIKEKKKKMWGIL